MQIMDFLNTRAVTLDLQSTKKADAIEELIQLLVDAQVVQTDAMPQLVEVLMNRESLGSTGIGQGIGIPHGKSACVNELVAALAISKQGVDFDSLDGEPAHIFFLLVAPEDSAGPHLKALALISRLLQDKYMRQALRDAPDVDTLLKLASANDKKDD